MESTTEAAEALVRALREADARVATAESLKARDFTPAPEVSKCRACDVRKVCSAAKLK